jgi:hypothetical protein
MSWGSDAPPEPNAGWVTYMPANSPAREVASSS